MRACLRSLVLPACLLAAAPAAGQGVLQATPPAAAWTEPTGWAAALDSFAARVAADVHRDGVGGITAAVFVGPTVVWARGFGLADPEHGVPAGVATVYRVGSISKSVTALLLADMVEGGEVALDAPVAGVLPELAGLHGGAPEAASITWRQLAAHTSGLAREPDLPDAARGPFALWEEKVLASIPTTELERRPGEAYGYSNIGYGILGLALARRAGRPFTELVQERLITPLAAADMAFILRPEQLPRLAVGQSNGNGSVDRATPAREHAGRGYKVPNGGIYATVQDLALFAAAVSGKAPAEIIGPALRREMLRVQTPEAPNRGYGLGLTVRVLDDGRRLVGHGGSVAGYTSQLLFEPASGVGVVVLRNYNRGATDLAAAATDLLEALLPPPG